MTGLFPIMPRDEYDALPRVNLSSLKLFGKSAAHYKHTIEHGRKDTTALRLGRAVHAAVLEPEKFAVEYTRWTGRRYGSAWEKFREAVTGEILTADEHDLCAALASAVRGDEHAAPYVDGGLPEVTALWETGAFQCRARLDYLKTDAIVDLKTARDASPGEFERASWRYGYHVQAAWYVDAVRACTERDLPFAIVAVEKEPPYLVQVYEVPEHVLDLGRAEYRGWLERLDYCRRENVWPGYASGPLQLGVPAWVTGANDDVDDLSGFELAEGT
jgi:hypothetical protein